MDKMQTVLMSDHVARVLINVLQPVTINDTSKQKLPVKFDWVYALMDY